MFNSVALIIVLVLGVVVLFSIFFAAYSYSNLSIGLEEKARTTTGFFESYINRSYNEYYQSCVRFTQNFEEKDHLELQFVSTNGKIVASSFGQWAGGSATTTDVAEAIANRYLPWTKSCYRRADHGGIQPHDLFQR